MNLLHPAAGDRGPSALAGMPLTSMTLVLVTAGMIGIWRLASRCAARYGVGREAVVVCVAVMLLAGVSTWAADSATWFDPATVRARDGPARIVAQVRITGPVMASASADHDCQAETRLTVITMDDVSTRTNAQVRLFASARDCAMLHRGAEYNVAGTLSEADWGMTPLWLTPSTDDDGRSGTHADDGTGSGEGDGAGADTDGGISMENAQPAFDRWREHAQESFFRATEGLTDAGRILVPGLTMGVLGQDHVDARRWLAEDGDGTDPIDETYAARLEDCFRNAGIMHLMAVSGGHFALLASLIRRLCARLLAPRQVTACLIAVFTTLMATMMAPGDSVTRALLMGWIAAAASFIGRPHQSLSSLGVTVLAMLLCDPSKARSFGLALSCAAVFGIIMLARPMADAMALLLPDALADATAMTVAAQIATLPIQVLMEPQLPLWSVPANIVVAPVVAFSTMTGLAGLAVAWVSLDVAKVCAWLASWGTRVMEYVALRLGEGPRTTIVWIDGILGALLLAAAEAAVIVMVRRASRWVRGSSGRHALPGDVFTADPRNRMRIWWMDTRRMIKDMRWGDMD
ncbi:ComEC/Rec2 family competence protein [Bifidobacterium aesculapii]|uniref:ComEC/Rec2 family competence protein n=1 Tax=Bifidobacterium aesculapii TaxID=1329411 RepID=UPI00128FB009|nr:ComEC/Rec2 family competence protein [Bifidobacterium aesculapii]